MYKYTEKGSYNIVVLLTILQSISHYTRVLLEHDVP